jgi:uncharacterized protein
VLLLPGIGLAAGLFSALLGVGGGTIAVPLLVVLARFPARAATAVSLAAIGVTALLGAVVFGLAGEVKVGHAALVGLPAVVGVLAGTALQQRLRTSTLSILFAALLVAVGVWLLVS